MQSPIPQDPRTQVEVYRTTSAKRWREYALVLHAMGLPHRSFQAQGAFVLTVPEEHASRALEEVERYGRENVGWPVREPAFEMVSDGVFGGLGYVVLLLAVYLLEQEGAGGFNWKAAGRGVGQPILDGEIWRCFTSLTLHGDGLHLLSNVVFGALFGALLAHGIGSGVAWLSIVVAGAAGNWLNALLHGPGHSWVGASTAVFAALGILTAWQWRRPGESRRARLRGWGALLAGAVLLSWFGTGGENLGEATETRPATDILAHFTGFASGLVVGIVHSLWPARELTPRRQTLIGLSAPLVLAIAWAAALLFG